MNISDCEQDDLWILKPLKRQKKVECTQTTTSTIKKIPNKKRQSNNSRFHDSHCYSTAKNDESNSPSFKEFEHIPLLSQPCSQKTTSSQPSSQKTTSLLPSSQKSSTSGLSNSKNTNNDKNKAKTRHPKKSVNMSSLSPAKTQTTIDLTKTNILSCCPVCQISSTVFLNNENVQKWFTHISRCLDNPIQFPENLQDGMKFSMTEEFLEERRNAGNLDSLPIPQDTYIKREATSTVSSSKEPSLQSVTVESDGKVTSIDAFKRNFLVAPLKTPKKNTTKSPGKSTPIKRISNKSPLVKDSNQQTLMYDFDRKELVLTPRKTPSSQTSKRLSSPVHTPKKQVWESLSVRKPTPQGKNSSLLSALDKDDSNFPSVMNSPSLQRKNLACSLNNDYSDSVLSDVHSVQMITPSKNQQPSSHSQINALGKSKSDQSYVTALFLSSDSEDDDDDFKKEKTEFKSIKNISDSEEDSVATEPAMNLDLCFNDSDETISFQNLLAEDSVVKAKPCSPLETHKNHSQTVSCTEQNTLSDEELAILDISKASQSENPPNNDSNNSLSLGSTQSLPTTHTPLKMKFDHLSSPCKSNRKKGSSSKTNSVSSVSVNQTQLTSFFTQRTVDNQFSNTPNLESKTIEIDTKPIFLSQQINEKKNPSTEKNAKSVMGLEQFKNLFTKKPPSKKLQTISASASQPPVVPKSADPNNRAQKQSTCPFYKKIPETTITVDAFKYGLIPGCRAYFLTHFHYDHYQGITKHFKQPLYCSQVTANLVKLKIGVQSQYVHPLPLYCPVEVEGINVTLLDANHCPGATLFLFKRQDGKVILHTGDFRADSVMEEYNALKNVKIHQLFLDTTYCNPSYAFPSQQEVLDLSVALSISALQEYPKTLIVVGTYTIGKEKVFLAIAEAIKSKIGVTREKKKILDCQENSHLNKLVSLNMDECQVHVVKMNILNYKSLSQHLARYKHKFDRILAFRPTGWTHSDKNESLTDIKPTFNRDNITLYGLPYSEHSSFTEMKRFVQFVQPEKIIPTVNNGSPSARKTMDDIFKLWMSEKSTNNKLFFLPKIN